MIEALGGAAQTTTQSTAGLGGLGSDAFLKLLVAQLRYQNPMEPADGTQMLQQTAQFSQVETLQALAETQQQLMGISQFSLAVGLSGQTVTALDGGGNRIEGEVQGIRFTADGPQLQIEGGWIPMSAVVEVKPGA